MKHWKHFTVLAILTMLLLSSCATTVYVKRPHKVEDGSYIVRIDFDGALEGSFREKQVKYAINQFVKSKKYESYDFEFIEKGWGHEKYSITMPGSIPVEKMKKVRYWRFF
jgi:uncharacterized protein YxeA